MNHGYFEDAVETRDPVDVDDLDDLEDDFEPTDVVIRGDAMSDGYRAYFRGLEEDLQRIYALAEHCRAKGLDPATKVEIPQAEDLAARVEQLVGPPNVAPRIRELSDERGREEAALLVAKEVVQGRFGEIPSREAAVEQAVRTGLAILTEGILVAPLEGIAGVRLEENGDGTDCVAVSFAGPIRAAGGTGQALSVLIADVVRRELGIGRYQPTRAEIDRFKEEIPAYKQAVNLQYTPTNEEIDLIVRNCPVMVDGEGTEQEEVGGNRDLPRVASNRLRGGACLVVAEGLTLKAPKLQKHVRNLGLAGWEFIDTFVRKGKEKGEGDEDEARGQGEGAPVGPAPIEPNWKYIRELVAGRPVFGHPSRKGGFRLRYGRSRTGGLASTAVHPATMTLVDDFLAVGTQMKIERPGKATVATPCDTIEPPIVLLHDGSLVEVTTTAEAKEIRPRVKRIIDLGEILVPFGEFAENNKVLPASGYSEDWWRAEVEAVGLEVPDLPDGAAALAFASQHDLPIPPRWNLFWHDLAVEDVERLHRWVAAEARLEGEVLILPRDAERKELLVELGALHRTTETALRVERHGLVLARCLGLEPEDDGSGALAVARSPEDVPAGDAGDALALVSFLAGVEVRARAPYRIGARMGRPEKAAERKMSPPVHGLVPLGHAGGPQRLIPEAAEAARKSEQGGIPVEVGLRKCPACKRSTTGNRCPRCVDDATGEPVHTEAVEGRPDTQNLPIHSMLEEARESLGMARLPETIKGVQGLISAGKNPEPMEKALLRALHDVTTFKDGTIRFDMTDVTLTHFRPREIHTPVAKLRELGYTRDIHGDPLERDDQVLELKVQDVIVSTSCLEYLERTAAFVDDLLTRFYGVKPFYELKRPEDLVGHLVVGLAPHTSGGVLTRVIGHTRAAVGFAHPYYHAAKRRNCFHGDTEILVYQGGHARKVRLADLVDPAVSDRGRPADAHGTLLADAPQDLEILSLEPGTRTPRRLPVTKLLRGTTEAWVHLETSTHRSIQVTPDHEVLVKRDGRLTHVPARDVQEGDQVPVGRSLPREPVAPTFNVGREIAELPADRIGDVRIRRADAFLRSLMDRAGRHKVAEICGASEGQRAKPSRWFRAFPLRQYRRLVEAGVAAWEDLPHEAVLGVARDQVEVPLRIPATPALCWLVGIYLAEGHARSNDSAHQVSWRNSEPAIIHEIELVVEEELGLHAHVSEDRTRVTVSSRILHALLVDAWGAGSVANTKRVPGWCYDLPEDRMADVLAGYLDGDGTTLPRPPRLQFYSKNGRLLEDVALLLQALGVFTRFVPGKPRAPGAFLRERYARLEAGAPELLDPVDGLSVAGRDIKHLAGLLGPRHPAKRDRLMDLLENGPDSRVIQVGGRQHDPEAEAHVLYDRVAKVRLEETQGEATYCLDVDSGSDDITTRNVLLGNGLYQIRCDGDEDCLMLLLDGLLNFSRAYLPASRGGLMDAPLTLSTRIDPSEIDGEAHNVDVGTSYPLAFFEATLEHPKPKDVAHLIEMVADRLGTEAQYEGFGFTHDTADVAEGPAASAYKTIGDMMGKMESQLELAVKLRGVDAPDVAARVIGSHFLPDLIGNLRAFSKQKVRCTKCNTKFRRVPLSGRCLKCDNPTLTLTVHEGSVVKYLEVSKEVCERYGVKPYVRQRIEHIEDSIESLFHNDKVKKAKLSDFL